MPAATGSARTSLGPIPKNSILVDLTKLTPVFLRRLVGSQIICCHLPLTETAVVRTVGGQTVCVDTSQEKVTVNTIPIKQVLSVDACTVIILEKLLFIKSKDFENLEEITKLNEDSIDR